MHVYLDICVFFCVCMYVGIKCACEPERRLGVDDNQNYCARGAADASTGSLEWASVVLVAVSPDNGGNRLR